MSPKFAAFLILLLAAVLVIPSISGNRTIINNSGSAFNRVSISPSGSSNWIYVSTGMAADREFMFTFEDCAMLCSNKM